MLMPTIDRKIVRSNWLLARDNLRQSGGEPRRQGSAGIPLVSPPLTRPTSKHVMAKLSKLARVSPVFQDSRAWLFAGDVIRAVKLGDLDMFATSVYAYDNVCRLDDWCLR